MKISVIIPVYNVSKYIEKALKSVLDQSFQEPHEVIIVDDCSPDNSLQIIEDIISVHPHEISVSILRHQENKGQSAARNFGIRESKGEYIFFLDSDDEIKPQTLALLYKKVTESNADFVCGETEILNERNYSVEHTNYYDQNGNCLNGNQIIFEKRVSGKWSLTPWNKLIKRSFLTENELFFYEGIYYEDLLWSVCVAIKANKIAFIPQITYVYKIHENSTSSSMSEKHINSFLIETKELYNLILSNNLLKKYGDVALKLFELNRKLVVDWTIPKVSENAGKKIIFELQKYNLKSLARVWISSKLEFKLKLRSSAFYLNSLGYNYIKMLSNGGKIFK